MCRKAVLNERIETRSLNSDNRLRNDACLISSSIRFLLLKVPRTSVPCCTRTPNQLYTCRLALFRFRLNCLVGRIHCCLFFASLVIHAMAILQTQRTFVCHRSLHSLGTRCFFPTALLRLKAMRTRSTHRTFARSLAEESSPFFWSYSTAPGFLSSVAITQTIEQQQNSRYNKEHNTLSNHTIQARDIPQTTHSFSTLATQPFLEKIFALDLPEGHCVGVRLVTPTMSSQSSSSSYTSSLLHHKSSPLLQWLHTTLHPKEVEYGLTLPSDSARHSFFIGRLAMRSAMHLTTSLTNTIQTTHRVHHPLWKTAHSVSTTTSSLSQHPSHWNPSSSSPSFTTLKPLNNHLSILQQFWNQLHLPIVGHSDPSILKDVYGRPQIPYGFLGSISHKSCTGVALVTLSNTSVSIQNHPSTDILTENVDSSVRKSVGVDIERTFSRRSSIAKKVLTPNEMKQLGKLENVTKDEEVLLRFSLKECVYKAMHPLISQRVGFQEAEVTPHEDGTATVVLNLKSGAHERFAEVKAHWRRLDLPITHVTTASTKEPHPPHLGGDDESGGQYFLTSSSVTLKYEK